MNKKSLEWIRRYLPAFLIATAFTLIFSNIAIYYIKNPIIVAYIGAWGGIFSYYVFIITRELFNEYKKEKKFKINFILKVFRNLLFEFTPAEIMDVLLVSPFFLFIFPKMISNFSLAILLGKLCADIIFYSITILFYEIRKNVFK